MTHLTSLATHEDNFNAAFFVRLCLQSSTCSLFTSRQYVSISGVCSAGPLSKAEPRPFQLDTPECVYNWILDFFLQYHTALSITESPLSYVKSLQA